jgi:hypothetical protein
MGQHQTRQLRHQQYPTEQHQQQKGSKTVHPLLFHDECQCHQRHSLERRRREGTKEELHNEESRHANRTAQQAMLNRAGVRERKRRAPSTPRKNTALVSLHCTAQLARRWECERASELWELTSESTEEHRGTLRNAAEGGSIVAAVEGVGSGWRQCEGAKSRRACQRERRRIGKRYRRGM